MKLKYLALALLIALPATELHAQKRKKKTNSYITDYTEVKDSMAVYNFEAAIEMLEEDIEKRTKRRKPTDEADSLLELAHRTMGRLLATERVVIIDSIIVNKQDVLRHIHLSTESGSLQAMRELLNKPDTTDCTMFRNQLDNVSVFAQADANGRLTLYQSELIGTEWTKPKPLKGISDEDTPADYNYPFMLTDGATLYYAARDEESLGGYDIYMTRFDADEQTFLAPENIGMPFNSTANDYLFAIDEFYNLGWFATDRNMPQGKVCVYTFIPNETRKIYNEAKESKEQLSRQERHTNNKQTWMTKDHEDEARGRLGALLAAEKENRSKTQFDFVLNDRKTCHTEADFKNAEVRAQVKAWQESSRKLQSTRSQLQALRDKYAASSDAQKSQMAAKIRLLESEFEKLLADVERIEKDIRSKELGQ